jgi:hypothetical protein
MIAGVLRDEQDGAGKPGEASAANDPMEGIASPRLRQVRNAHDGKLTPSREVRQRRENLSDGSIAVRIDPGKERIDRVDHQQSHVGVADVPVQSGEVIT